MQSLAVDSAIGPQSIISQNSVTRKAGGRKEAEKESQVCNIEAFLFSCNWSCFME